MRETTVKMPVIAAVAATRVMLGAGLGLLLADRLGKERKRATGWALLLAGAASTVPLMLRVRSGCRQGK